MILDDIIASTKRRLVARKEHRAPAVLRAQAEQRAQKRLRSMPPPKTPASLWAPATQGAVTFAEALRAPGVAVICEVKKASPSHGPFAGSLDAVTLAREYESAGAAAISVLTEPEYFSGSLEDLRHVSRAVAVPCLRKDFVIDRYQLDEACLAGAAAVLLIVAVLDDQELCALVAACHDYGMDALVETRTAAEVSRALHAGARVVGVNNRDLTTLSVDLQTSLRLRPLVPPDVLFVAESGISTRAHVELLEQAGADAVLVGTAAVLAPDRHAFVAELAGLSVLSKMGGASS
ncbi:MAG: indole-3-glycerol phosphate synthase TrpC [Coriobacteriales bacterium]|jgi:indole-3-glycerol phosphate synthase|nr:indole-3-glycerol phosphate synthase TrpC [Coriobacteriales bacterium]